MARAWITDQWVKDATVTLPDGTKTKISATSAQLKSLKTLPEHFRTSKFGVGMRWSVGWYEPQRDGDDKMRRRSYAKRSDAERFAAELEDDIRMGRYIDPSAQDMSFQKVAEAWLGSKARIKDSTYRRYERELANYVRPKWSTRPIGAIQRKEIDAWVQELAEGTAPFDFSDSSRVSKSRRKPGKMKASYIRHIVGATFGGTLRYAVAEQWIGRNPLEKVELPRDEGDIENDLPNLTYLEVEEVAAEAQRLTRRSSDRVLLLLLAYSGPRIGEATALKIKDLDVEGDQARIMRTWTTDREGKRKLGPAKTWEKRWLPIPHFIMEEVEKLVKDRDPEEYIFTSARGGAVDGKNWYNRVWVKARANVGLPGHISVHDLRHVAATLAIAAGADVKLVQQMLGHKDATETLNTYAHLWPNRLAEVSKVMAERREKALALAA